MKNNRPAAVLFAVLFMALGQSAVCQNTMPEILDKGTLSDQLKWVQEKTLIYENYRAIREDMFQKIKTNSVDSLDSAKRKISSYINLTGTLNNRITSLKDSLKVTQGNLDDITRTKNSISVIGININKITYNTIMWLIIAGLLVLLGIGYLVFMRNRTVTVNAQKELRDLKTEYEEYRKKTRLDREKMSMDHFKEIQRLRGDKK